MSECSGSVQRSVAITVPNRRSDSISAHDHASGLDGTCFFNALIMFFWCFLSIMFFHALIMFFLNVLYG